MAKIVQNIFELDGSTFGKFQVSDIFFISEKALIVCVIYVHSKFKLSTELCEIFSPYYKGFVKTYASIYFVIEGYYLKITCMVKTYAPMNHLQAG